MKSFFEKLRKRHVFKVGIGYVLIAWVVLQVADITLPAMGFADWSIALVLNLLALGFPVAIVIALIFDLKSLGDNPVEASTEQAAAALTTDEPVTKPETDHSIAVLPFPDLSAERDQEHFCDGLTEEILNVLTCIPQLRVASRTSCFAFKNNKAELSEVADKLRVGHILEGSVRKSGNKLRITAQLIEVASDSHLWSETYDRELQEIFEIQDDIAKHILNALKLKLGSVDSFSPTTTDPKAYEYFLRGRGYAVTNTVEDTRIAVSLFEKAVSLDPGFLRAWIEIAEYSSKQAIFYEGGEEAQKVSSNAGQEALQLAPNSAGSYFAFGLGQLACNGYTDAETAFKKALELDPVLVRAWHFLGRAAHHQGHTDKEVEYFTKATELDTDDWESPSLALSGYERKGDGETVRRMAVIAVERIEKHLEDYPNNPRAYYLGAYSLWILGQRDRAQKWAERSLELADDIPTRYNLACFYAKVGGIEKSLDLLENSILSRSWIEHDSDLDPIRDHPRYKVMIEGLPE